MEGGGRVCVGGGVSCELSFCGVDAVVVVDGTVVVDVVMGVSVGVSARGDEGGWTAC